MRDFADHVIWGSAVRETHEFWGDPDTNGGIRASIDRPLGRPEVRGGPPTPPPPSSRRVRIRPAHVSSFCSPRQMERLSAYGGAHAANDDDRGGGVNLSTDERAFLSALGRDRALVTDRARMASVARALALGGDAPTRPRLHHHHHRGGARPSTAAAARSAPVTPARPSTSAGWYGDGNGNDDGNELSALSPLPRARKDFLRKGEGRRGDGGGTASASASARSSPAAAGGGSRSRRPATASANAARRSVEGSPLRPRSARAPSFARRAANAAVARGRGLIRSRRERTSPARGARLCARVLRSRSRLWTRGGSATETKQLARSAGWLERPRGELAIAIGSPFSALVVPISDRVRSPAVVSEHDAPDRGDHVGRG